MQTGIVGVLKPFPPIEEAVKEAMAGWHAWARVWSHRISIDPACFPDWCRINRSSIFVF